MSSAKALCQLAGEWQGEVPTGGLMGEVKVDGWRALYFRGIDGQPRLWSRNGMPLEGADHVLYRLKLMEAAAGVPMYFDGEIQVGGSLAATKAWFESGWRRGGEAGNFHAFDCMTQAEWRAGGTATPLYARKARLAALAKAVDDDPTARWEWRPGSRGRDEGMSPVVIMPDEWAFDAADVLAMARRVWSADGEGLMLKDAEAPYQRNRSATWLKVKHGGPWRLAA